MDVPPDLRANIDYVIVLRDNIKVNRERVYSKFIRFYSFVDAPTNLSCLFHCLKPTSLECFLTSRASTSA